MTVFEIALKKIVEVLSEENIEYMIVGGFAVSYHNRARTTNDIDLILRVRPKDAEKILKHFPDWIGFQESFAESIQGGGLFNLTDFETGMRYDFMTLSNTEYNLASFDRKENVSFLGIDCYMCSKEDLVIFKLKWYNLTPNEKQMEDLKFLMLDKGLNMEYVTYWIDKLNLKTFGILE